MDSDADAAVKTLLRELNKWLRLSGFRRRGQTFARESAECWQVVNVQLSAFSPRNEKSLTVNVGVQSKSVLRFTGEDPSKPPLHYTCPINFRVSWLMQRNDVWWAVRDDSSARSALVELVDTPQNEGLPFLDSLQTDKDILQLFGTGQVLGFEMNRDETRLLLLAETGAGSKEVRQRLDDYEAHWLPTGATERASKFLRAFKNSYALAAD
jgi:hypothetical protein